MIEHDPRHNRSVEIDVRPFDGKPREFLESVWTAFSESVSEESAPLFEEVLEFDRAIAAYDGKRVVGNAAAFSFELTVPGGMLPAAGVTTVGVHPTHRRRGVLRRMMRLQLDDVHQRGEPLAILWASEAIIYQRYGYGLGSLKASLRLDRHRSAFRRPHEFHGQVRLVPDDEARTAFPLVYDAVRPSRIGFFSHSPEFWNSEVFHFPAAWRRGRGEPFNVVHEVDGAVDGYARYAIREGESNEVSVLALLGANPAAHLDLWRYLADIDLMSRVEAWNIALDDPILLAVAEPRRLELTLGDALWLRVVDVPAALGGRGYARDGRLVLEVRDEFCPWNAGRWSLEVDGGRATVSPSTDAPDVECDITDLGAAYLGAFSFARLSAATRIGELAPGGVARADELFQTERAPWCPDVF